MNRFSFPALLVLSLTLAVLCAAGPVSAEDLRVPEGDAVVLDGRVDEAAWKSAVPLPIDGIEVPVPGGKRELAPAVKAVLSEGRLCVSVVAAEDPGAAIGLHVFLAPAAAETAGEAVSISFRPVAVRAPRITARGPRGVGRTKYRVEAAADWSRAGRWSAELGVPLADVVEDSKAPLRMAVAVFTRTPNQVAVWPADARWKGPATWGVIRPAGGSWPSDVVRVDEAAFAEADAADARRAKAWIDFLKGTNIPVDPLMSAGEVRAHMETAVFDPLKRILANRPDLAVPVACIQGDVRIRLGQWDRAREVLQRALGAAPGWREAAYGLHVKMARRPLLPTGRASDYAAVGKRLERAVAALPEGAAGFEADGLALSRALLAYYAGDFADAIQPLERLAALYPHDAFIRNHADFARKGQQAAARETQRRKRDELKRLPHAILMTTKGKVVFELYQDDAPNTVSNFVYLGRKGYYDGVAVHRTVPFFLAQTGDGLSRSKRPEDKARVGLGTPGYAIRSEPNERSLLRGVVAMANAGRNTEGSQFFVTTGTAIHLAGDQTVLGRVVGGQDVLESLTEADRIESVTFERLDPARRYHPTDASGRPAPEPR